MSRDPRDAWRRGIALGTIRGIAIGAGLMLIAVTIYIRGEWL